MHRFLYSIYSIYKPHIPYLLYGVHYGITFFLCMALSIVLLIFNVYMTLYKVKQFYAFIYSYIMVNICKNLNSKIMYAYYININLGIC